MIYGTKREATEAWVNGFNAVPADMIEDLMSAYPYDWDEITPVTEDDTVFVYDESAYGAVVEISGDEYTVALEDESIVHVKRDEFEPAYEDNLPIWRTLWSFGNFSDDLWLEKNLRTMAELGFRIYKSDRYGYFFGIDHCGYDFYKAHWIPLYEARGMEWHRTDNEKVA